MTSDDLHAKLFRDRVRAEDWRVEKYDEDGGCEVAIFSGPDAQERAREALNRSIDFPDHGPPALPALSASRMGDRQSC